MDLRSLTASPLTVHPRSVDLPRHSPALDLPSGEPASVDPDPATLPPSQPITGELVCASDELQLKPDHRKKTDFRRSKYKIKDSKIRRAVLVIMAMRASGHTHQEIADELQYSVKTIASYIRIGYEKGWIEKRDLRHPDDYVDTVIVPKVMRNVEECLDARNQLGLPDRDMTIEAAKGTGVFKVHKSGTDQPIVNQQMALKVQIEMPHGHGQTPGLVPRTGTIGGQPSYRETGDDS